jgi:hypothetical protein
VHTNTITTSTTTVNTTLPSTFPAVASGQSFTVTIRWRYANKNKAPTVTPITSLCVDYVIASESGTIKHCNLVGTNKNNPVQCD